MLHFGRRTFTNSSERGREKRSDSLYLCRQNQLKQTSLSDFQNLQFQHSTYTVDYVIDFFPSLLSVFLASSLLNGNGCSVRGMGEVWKWEKLIEFEIISEFNTDLVLNDEEITLKPNKLINFILRSRSSFAAFQCNVTHIFYSISVELWLPTNWMFFNFHFDSWGVMEGGGGANGARVKKRCKASKSLHH